MPNNLQIKKSTSQLEDLPIPEILGIIKTPEALEYLVNKIPESLKKTYSNHIEKRRKEVWDSIVSTRNAWSGSVPVSKKEGTDKLAQENINIPEITPLTKIIDFYYYIATDESGDTIILRDYLKNNEPLSGKEKTKLDDKLFKFLKKHNVGLNNGNLFQLDDKDNITGPANPESVKELIDNRWGFSGEMRKMGTKFTSHATEPRREVKPAPQVSEEKAPKATTKQK